MKRLLTCEHGGNQIPSEYAHLFAEAEAELYSHRGVDFGALTLFERLRPLADFSIFSQTSRLLVELNRSLGHPQLFSEFTAPLGDTEKNRLIELYYLPYRTEVSDYIAAQKAAGESVMHLSVHSFTPIFKGEVRQADIGLLFDPADEREVDFCEKWAQALQAQNPQLTIRSNYPYLGIDDGLTTHLRGKFPNHYAGIELEVNQQFDLDQRLGEMGDWLWESLQACW